MASSNNIEAFASSENPYYVAHQQVAGLTPPGGDFLHALDSTFSGEHLTETDFCLDTSPNSSFQPNSAAQWPPRSDSYESITLRSSDCRMNHVHATTGLGRRMVDGAKETADKWSRGFFSSGPGWALAGVITVLPLLSAIIGGIVGGVGGAFSDQDQQNSPRPVSTTNPLSKPSNSPTLPSTAGQFGLSVIEAKYARLTAGTQAVQELSGEIKTPDDCHSFAAAFYKLAIKSGNLTEKRAQNEGWNDRSLKDSQIELNEYFQDLRSTIEENAATQWEERSNDVPSILPEHTTHTLQALAKAVRSLEYEGKLNKNLGDRILKGAELTYQAEFKHDETSKENVTKAIYNPGDIDDQFVAAMKQAIMNEHGTSEYRYFR